MQLKSKFLKHKKPFIQIATAISGMIACIAALVAIVQYFEVQPSHSISGKWRLDLTIESTNYQPYQGMHVGYVLFLTNKETHITGNGEKYWLNEKILPTEQHDHIELIGTIYNDSVHFIFELHGLLRKTVGEFNLVLSEDRNELTGTFNTTGASSSGSVIAKRITDHQEIRATR